VLELGTSRFGGVLPVHASAAALYATFPPEEARGLWERLEVHYTPKHGSWLDMAEIELSVLTKQCLNRRIADAETLTKEVAAWYADRNNKQAMHVQVIHDQDNFLGRLVPAVKKGLHELCPILLGPSLSNCHLSPVSQWLSGHEEVPDTQAFVFMVNLCRLSGSNRLWYVGIGWELFAGFINADHRIVWTIWSLIDFQYILHGGYKGRVSSWCHAPLLNEPRLKLVFLSVWRTAS